MISFIVIGRNEGWKLLLCLKSISTTVIYNHLISYEIIYVDSNSEDDSVNVAVKLQIDKIVKLTGDYNAAIARNVGAQESSGEILFFLDGDMELIPGSFGQLFDKNQLKYPFISGDFTDHYYNNLTIAPKRHHKIKATKRSFTTGGLFIIKKDLWISVKGMRNEFKRSQDFDLGLRLAKNGVFLYRLPIELAKHYTISYEDKFRKWKMLTDNSHLWGRCYLYRMNLYNIWCWKLMLKQDYSLLLLLLVLILFLFTHSFYVFTYYIIIILFRSIKKNVMHLANIPIDFSYYIIRDCSQLVGFIFFHPNKKKNIQYQIIEK